MTEAATAAQPRRPNRQRFALLTGLCGLAVVQPLLEVFGASPETFILLDISTFAAVTWLVWLCLAVPVVLFLIERLAAIVGSRAAQVARVVTVAVPVGLFAARLFSAAPRGIAVPLAVLVGLAAGYAIERSNFARSWASMTVVALPVFLMLFALSPAGEVFRGATHLPPAAAGVADTPVVMVVFDELPTATLMNGSATIDAELFPGFARLAALSTWYPDATTVAPRTPDAIPAIVTGNLPPADGRAALARNYDHTVFSLLADSHRQVAYEQITGMCPRNICSDGGGTVQANTSAALRSLTLDTYAEVVGWSGNTQLRTYFDAPFDETAPRRIDTFIDELNAEPATVHYLHTLFPHGPYLYTGEGRRYDAPNFTRGLFGVRWLDETSATLGRQRHIEQTRLADAKVTALLDRLEAQGQLNDALIIVTADHGIAFGSGEIDRGLSTTNAAQVLWVPLFVKYPGRDGGVVDTRAARTIDIVPTIVDVLGADTGDARFDGTSLLGEPTTLDTLLVTGWGRSELEPSQGRFVAVSAATGRADLANLQPVNPRMGGVDGLYAFGEFGPELFARPVRELEVLAPSGEVAVLETRYADRTWPDRGDRPLYLSGHIKRPPSDEHLAVAVNGVVAAVVPTSIFSGHEETSWWTLVPAKLMDREGDNTLALYVVTTSDDGPALVPLELRVE
jgi:hypothetical protein